MCRQRERNGGGGRLMQKREENNDKCTDVCNERHSCRGITVNQLLYPIGCVGDPPWEQTPAHVHLVCEQPPGGCTFQLRPNCVEPIHPG